MFDQIVQLWYLLVGVFIVFQESGDKGEAKGGREGGNEGGHANLICKAGQGTIRMCALAKLAGPAGGHGISGPTAPHCTSKHREGQSQSQRSTYRAAPGERPL